jgi:hypothetical protein
MYASTVEEAKLQFVQKRLSGPLPANTYHAYPFMSSAKDPSQFSGTRLKLHHFISWPLVFLEPEAKPTCFGKSIKDVSRFFWLTGSEVWVIL